MKINNYQCPIYNINFNDSHYLNSDGRWKFKFIWGDPTFISCDGDGIFHNEYLATLNKHNLIFNL